MSRTFADNAGLTALEGQVIKPFWMTMTAQDDVLHFELNTSIGNLTQDTDICTSLFQSSATAGQVAGMDTNGVLYITETNFAGNSMGISSANTSRVRVTSTVAYIPCLRGSFSSSGEFWWTEAATFGTGVQLWKGSLSGTTLTRTMMANSVTLGAVGTMSNSSSFVRRVESVCRTSNGTVIAVGNYDFTQALATIEFFLYDSTFYPTGVKQLETIVQFEFTETYTDWHSHGKKGSFTHAATSPVDSDKIVIVSNDGRRAMKFTVRHAVESQLEPVIPIDYDLGGELPQHTFMPTGIMLSADLLHLSGRYTRPFSDGSSVVLEMYSTSKDGDSWSVGEYSSFITSLATYQVLPVLSNSYTSPTRIYTIGSLISYSAAARVIDGNGSASSILSYITDGTIESATNSGDQLTIQMRTTPASVRAGRLIKLAMGLKDAAGVSKGGDYGRYMVMNSPANYSPYGQTSGEVQALDEASWRLVNWAAPTDVDRWSSSVIPDPYTTNPTLETTLMLMSPSRDITFAATGFSTVALNDPFVAYSTTRDERDGLTSIRGRFTSTDMYSQQTIGLIFGGSADEFNAFIVPRPGTWLETTTYPFVARSNLNGGSWDFSEQQTGVWKSVLDTQFAKMMKHPNASASANDTYIYGPNASTFIEANEDYRFTLRTQGRRAQVFARKMRTEYDELSDYSETEILAEYRFGPRFKRKHDDRQYFGAICGTDVPGSTDWWRQGQYGDLSASLTDTSGLYSLSDFGTKIGTGVFTYSLGGSGSVNSVSMLPAATLLPGGTLPVDWYCRLHYTSGSAVDATFQVASKSSGSVNSDFVVALVNGTSTGNANVDIYVYKTDVRFGWASSRPISELDSDGILSINDPRSVKRNELALGRGAFMSDDNSAVSIRYAETDGVVHSVLSQGNIGLAWDMPTNPVDGFGSQPGNWRFVMNHGLFFEGEPSQYGLPTNGYMAFRVQSEIVRGLRQTYIKAGFASSFVGCYIPTWYRPLGPVAKNSTSLVGWKSGANLPGDNFDVVETAMGSSFPGMLCEVVSRNISSTEEAVQYYTVDAYTSGGYDYVTLDKPYAGELQDLEAYAVISGRGWGGTSKVVHPADSPAVYCPLEASDIAALTAPVDYIRLDKFQGVIGLYNSAEDDIKYSCALAGVRNPTFGSKYSATIAPSSSGVTLSASESNFVLELNAHLFSNGDSLKVGFRNNYVLDLRANNSLTGFNGVLELRLETTSSGITATSGTKWLDRVKVPISDWFPFGVLSSGGARTEATGTKNNYRIIVNNNIVRVEMEGMLVFAFDLKDYDYSTSGVVASNYTQGYGPVTVKYSVSSALTMTARLQELSEEVENHVIDIASSGDSTISFVTSERHILMRSTHTGGVEFSRYLTRPSTETVADNVITVSENELNLDPLGHTQVSGAEYGEYVDQIWIQENGYKFGSGSNRLLNTVSDSVTEARLLQRISKENANQYALQMSGVKYKWQPEDGITWNGLALTVSAVSIAFGKDYRSSSYTLRDNHA